MKRQADDVGYALVLGVVGLTVLFLVAPIIVAAAMSLDSRTYLGPFPPPGLSLQWYERFFTDKYFLRGLQTSLILAVVAASISTVVGVLTAVVIDRYEFKGKAAMTTFFLSPLVVPAVVVGFALLMFFSLIGVYDGFWRLLGGHVIITVPLHHPHHHRRPGRNLAEVDRGGVEPGGERARRVLGDHLSTGEDRHHRRHHLRVRVLDG